MPHVEPENNVIQPVIMHKIELYFSDLVVNVTSESLRVLYSLYKSVKFNHCKDKCVIRCYVEYKHKSLQLLSKYQITK